MRDHRQWTSVRDSHMESMYKDNLTTNSKKDDKSMNLRSGTCAVTDDIVNVDETLNNSDAILEAEKLLDQLDLLSSE